MMQKQYKRQSIPVGFSFLDTKTTAELQNKARRSQKILEQRGFERIMPPSIDYPQTFDVFDNDSFFRFGDRYGESLALRNDVTVQVIKGFAHQLDFKNKIDKGCKLYYTVPVFLNSHGSVPPLREIYQLGAEIVGGSSRTNIEELIDLAANVMREVFSGNFIVQLSDVTIIEELQKLLQTNLDVIARDKDVSSLAKILPLEKAEALSLASMLLLSKYQANLNQECIALLQKALGKQNQQNGEIVSNIEKKLGELELMSRNLQAQKINNQWQILSARKTKYYSGLTFEIYIDSMSHAPLRGGCYDELLSQYADFSANAAGFALDLSLMTN